jgi:hypothetical protein
MAWVLGFAAVSFGFYAWTLWRQELTPLDSIILLPWPLAIVIGSLFSGFTIFSALIPDGLAKLPAAIPGLVCLAAIFGSFALLAGIALAIRARINRR